jgi:hypothetical protein
VVKEALPASPAPPVTPKFSSWKAVALNFAPKFAPKFDWGMIISHFDWADAITHPTTSVNANTPGKMANLVYFISFSLPPKINFFLRVLYTPKGNKKLSYLMLAASFQD